MISLLPNDLLIFGGIVLVKLLLFNCCFFCCCCWSTLWVVILSLCFFFGKRYVKQNYVGSGLSFCVDSVSSSSSSHTASSSSNLLSAVHIGDTKSDDVFLSVVIPAFNEQERLPAMLDEALGWLKKRLEKDSQKTYECIVVDDCSSDGTADVVLKYAKKDSNVHLVKLPQNHGKGYAVKQGVYCCRGKYILMADADGATSFPDVRLLEDEIVKIQNVDGTGIVCGSRRHLVNSEQVAKRKPLRNLLMHIFHWCVSFTFWAANGTKEIDDTQCGFKLFTRNTARSIFPLIHLERWSFDVEILLIARHLKHPIGEVSVNWTEIPGSKLKATSMINMGLELLLLCVCYRFRIWNF